jgi:hypothetical protein
VRSAGFDPSVLGENDWQERWKSPEKELDNCCLYVSQSLEKSLSLGLRSLLQLLVIVIVLRFLIWLVHFLD